MRTIIEFRARLTGQVDREAGIISNVTICTADLQAKGHDLWTDSVTLEQMAACAMGRQVPVRTRHGGGASDVIGWIENVYVDGAKLKGDLHLLENFAGRNHFLEMAEAMPGGIGLSAAFQPEEDPVIIGGRKMARCRDLLAVDFTTQPATNPSGLFGDDIGDISPRLRALGAKLRLCYFANAYGSLDSKILRSAAAGSLLGAAVALRPTGRPVGNGNLRPGDVLERPFAAGIAQHRGVAIAGRGGLDVVHAARPPGEHGPIGQYRIARESIGAFRGGGSLRVQPSSDAMRRAAAKNATAGVGQRGRYNLITSNSDSALRRLNIPAVRSQVRRALAGAAIGGGAGASAAVIVAKLRLGKQRQSSMKTFESRVSALAAKAQRAMLEFAAPRPGGFASSARALLGRLKLPNTVAIAGAAAGGAILGRALTKRRPGDDNEPTPGSSLARRAAGAAVGAAAGGFSGNLIFKNNAIVRAALARLRERGGFIGRAASAASPRGIGAVVGGLAGATFFESVADDSRVFFEARIPRVSEAAARQLAITIAQHTGPGYGKSGHTAKTIARRTGLSQAEVLRRIETGELRPAKARRSDDPTPAFFEAHIEKLRATGLRQIALEAFQKRRAEGYKESEAVGLVSLDLSRAVAIRDSQRG